VTSSVVDIDASVQDASTVVDLMQTDPERGLTADEAARRLAMTGPNEIAGAALVPV
jgi:P-type Ca2+ transporter type 2C